MRHSSLCLLLAIAVLGCKGTTGPKDGEVPPYPWATQAWRASMRARLHETRITKNHEGVPLERVLEDIAIQARVNVRTDQEVFLKPKDDLQVVRANFRACRADEALDAVLLPLGLAWALHDEFVYVTRPERLPHSPEKDDVAEAILRAQEAVSTHKRRQAAEASLERLTLKVDYDGTPLASVLEDIAEKGDVPIRFDRPGLAPPKGSPGVRHRSVSEVRAVSLLSMLLWENGLGYTWKGAEVRVVPRAEAELAEKKEAEDRLLGAKRVTLSAEKVPLRDLAKSMAQALSVPILLDEATWNRGDLVTLKVTDVELREVLVRIKDEAKCATVLMDGVIFFLAPSE